jgi:hypothetical protein
VKYDQPLPGWRVHYLPLHNHNDEAGPDIHPRCDIGDVCPVKIAIKKRLVNGVSASVDALRRAVG